MSKDDKTPAPADAAYKIAHLLTAMRRFGISGVSLKDASDRLQIGSN